MLAAVLLIAVTMALAVAARRHETLTPARYAAGKIWPPASAKIRTSFG